MTVDAWHDSLSLVFSQWKLHASAHPSFCLGAQYSMVRTSGLVCATASVGADRSVCGSIGLLRQLMRASVGATVFPRVFSLQLGLHKWLGLCDCFGWLRSLAMWIRWAAASAYVCRRMCVALFMNLLRLLCLMPPSTEQLAANIERLVTTSRPNSTTRTD